MSDLIFNPSSECSYPKMQLQSDYQAFMDGQKVLFRSNFQTKKHNSLFYVSAQKFIYPSTLKKQKNKNQHFLLGVLLLTYHNC